jgi:hypothetical protein
MGVPGEPASQPAALRPCGPGADRHSALHWARSTARRGGHRLVGRGDLLPCRDARPSSTTPIPAYLPPVGAPAGLDQLDIAVDRVASPGVVVTTKKIDPLGAQPTDPPWARLLFLLVQGRDGQWWRAILLVASLLLLVVALAGLVGMIAALPPLGGWISGAVGVGSLTAGGTLALCRRRDNTISR